MRALNLYGVNDLRYDEIGLPERKNTEVLLQIKAVGICGSDIPRVFDKGTYHFPTVIGHEFAGIVVEADNTDLIGRNAAVFPLIPCGECSACQCGRYAQCKQYNYYGSRCNGGMSEYIAVKKENLVFIPEGVLCKEAAMSEPAAVALHAFRKACVGIGNTIVIFGIGPIGLILAQWAKIAGLKNIVLVARNRDKVEFAQRLGFFQTINSSEMSVRDYVLSLTNGVGADACIEGTGQSATLEACLLAVRNFGKVVTMGNPVEAITLSQNAYWNILRKEICLVGTWNSSFTEMENDWKDALAAMQCKQLDVLPLITHEFTLAQYKEAFSIMREKKELYCKIMFVIEE